ncbi:hypothetical protein ACVXHA_29635 [Escherichia coli]
MASLTGFQREAVVNGRRSCKRQLQTIKCHFTVGIRRHRKSGIAGKAGDLPLIIIERDFVICRQYRGRISYRGTYRNVTFVFRVLQNRGLTDSKKSSPASPL